MKLSSYKQKIPKKIHFIFLAKNEPMPEFFNYCVNRAKEFHPDWEINFYNEDDAMQIVQNHFPELKNLYHAYPLNVQRADILRILIVYLYGGFYMDLDICCLKNLEPLLRFNMVLAEEKHLKREVCTALGLTNPKRIANYMFGSIPKHQFWLELLNEILEKSLIEIKNENDVLESTGPGLLTDFYHLKANSYKDIVLLLNKDRYCLNKFHKEIACHFGNYAAHLHTGTWRWQNGQTPKFNDLNQKGLPAHFDNSFRYKLENNKWCIFYFNQKTDGVDAVCNMGLANTFKNSGIAVEDISALFDENVVLYGPISKFMHEILPNNTYLFCSSSANADFAAEEVDFINKRFSYCIVPDAYLEEQYKANGITIATKIIEPGFRRYKRNLEDEHDIEQFKLGCFAEDIDVMLARDILQACQNLQKELIPSIKFKLYDPNAKLKDLNIEFEDAEFVEYVPITVNEEYFSSWFNDLAAAILGPTNEPCPNNILEFLYMGIPVIIPETDNYKRVLTKIASNPTVVMSSFNSSSDLNKNIISVENIEKAILDLYEVYEFYSANAINAAEELEDLLTIEETQQNILSLLSEG